MRYSPDNQPDITPTPDTSYEATDRLWASMQETAHLIVYMVNGEQLEEARRLAEDYFRDLDSWREATRLRSIAADSVRDA